MLLQSLSLPQFDNSKTESTWKFACLCNVSSQDYQWNLQRKYDNHVDIINKSIPIICDGIFSTVNIIFDGCIEIWYIVCLNLCWKNSAHCLSISHGSEDWQLWVLDHLILLVWRNGLNLEFFVSVDYFLQDSLAEPSPGYLLKGIICVLDDWNMITTEIFHFSDTHCTKGILVVPSCASSKFVAILP